MHKTCCYTCSTGCQKKKKIPGIKKVLLKQSTTSMSSSSSSHTAYGRGTFWSGFSVRLLGTLDHFLGQNVIALRPEQQRTPEQQEEMTVQRFVPDHLEIILSFPPQKHSGLSSGSQNSTSAVPKMWNPHGSQKTVTRKETKWFTEQIKSYQKQKYALSH